MDFHSLANIFPLMEGAEFDALVADIRENGLHEPIYTYEGQILDGRNRWRACLLANVEPRYETLNGQEPLQFVISKNLHRRHLNETQRAIVANKMGNMKQGDNRYSSRHANLHVLSVSREEAAKMLSISPRTVASIAFVEREAPELLPDMEAGNMTAHAAQKKAKTNKRLAERESIATAGEAIPTSDRWNVYHANMETWQAEKRYDFIVTDPPYPKEYLYLYETLAKRAKEWLKPNGLLIAMAGQSYLDQIYEMMGKHLIYYWTSCYLTLHQPTPLRQRNVNTTWKPLLVYTNGDRYTGKIFGDVYKSPQPQKENHAWEQSIEGMSNLVKQICLPGQSILDPFCGSGTTGVAALNHGCLFDGIELNINDVNISKKRLHDTQKKR